MARIAFLGLGKMGSGMARCLIRAGHEVKVWNRSSGKAGPLAAEGAIVAKTPAEAASEADAVFSMVADDVASERVWLGAMIDPANPSGSLHELLGCIACG